MEENKIDNLFEAAIKKSELEKFIVGESNYFILDKEIGEHWPLGSYKQFIEGYLKKHNELFDETIWHSLAIELEKNMDKNIFLDMLVGYLIPYYNPDNLTILKKRTDQTPIYFINAIRMFLSSNKESLIKDRRGTGAEWNSKEGLWNGIRNNLKIIYKRGGPNFMADNNDYL